MNINLWEHSYRVLWNLISQPLRNMGWRDFIPTFLKERKIPFKHTSSLSTTHSITWTLLVILLGGVYLFLSSMMFWSFMNAWNRDFCTSHLFVFFPCPLPSHFPLWCEVREFFKCNYVFFEWWELELRGYPSAHNFLQKKRLRLGGQVGVITCTSLWPLHLECELNICESFPLKILRVLICQIPFAFANRYNSNHTLHIKYYGVFYVY